MQPQDLQLLVAHAGWVLAADPEAGLEALLAMNPPLKPDLVTPIMQVTRVRGVIMRACVCVWGGCYMLGMRDC
jgi:hypothetical protein